MQLKVIAYDEGRPSLQATATVIVNINRNLNGPQVVPQSDIVFANETENPRTWHYSVNVTDPDSVSSFYILPIYVCNSKRKLHKHSRSVNSEGMLAH